MAHAAVLKAGALGNACTAPSHNVSDSDILIRARLVPTRDTPLNVSSGHIPLPSSPATPINTPDVRHGIPVCIRSREYITPSSAPTVGGPDFVIRHQPAP